MGKKFFYMGVSELSYKSKKEIIWAKVNYDRTKLDLEGLKEKVQEGYNFCHNFKKGHVMQKDKTKANWLGTNVVFIDIDNGNSTMETFVSNLQIKPSLSYTTYSNNEELKQFRFRLVYVFVEDISNENLYQQVYNTLLNRIQNDNRFKNKDDCGGRIAQQFAGNGSRECRVELGKVYNLDEILEASKSFANPMSFEDGQFIQDFYRMKCSEMIEKYKSKYPLFEATPLPKADDDIPYILLPSNYLEIKRSWIRLTDGTKKILRLKDGQGRRKKLFINLIMRRFMVKNITFEHLLMCLIYEMYNYIDNREDPIGKSELMTICQNACTADLSKFKDLGKKQDDRVFIVNKDYCKKHNVSLDVARNRSRKIINYKNIAVYYDSKLSIKKNLQKLEENGCKVGLTTLKEFRKEYCSNKLEDALIDNKILTKKTA